MIFNKRVYKSRVASLQVKWMRSRLVLLFLIIYSTISSFAQPLRVSDNGHYLIDTEGNPFFWLGDTGWEILHRLSRDEMDEYLADRAAKGFNLVQTVALAEHDGLNLPNANGDVPLSDPVKVIPATTPGSDFNDPEKYDYWDHVEYFITRAGEYGLIVGLLPCWGEYVTPRFREATFTDTILSYNYGHFLGNRYKKMDNIVWILGGDRLPIESRDGIKIWRAMAEGITDGVSGSRSHDGKADWEKTFMTFHCYKSTSTWFHHDSWLDMHMWGSYHEKKDNERAYFVPQQDWNLPDPKPTINSEPCYEDHPVNYKADLSLGIFDDFDARQAGYWSVFAGTCGHTYGCHPVWRCNTDTTDIYFLRKTWREALNDPGSFQMQHLKNLVLSRPSKNRRPDQLVLVKNPYDPTGQLQACRGDDYMMIYIPAGKQVSIYTNWLRTDKVVIWWYNPRTGKSSLVGAFTNKDFMEFDPPGKKGRGNDWVLVIDNAYKKFPPPGEAIYYPPGKNR